jgi:hypothetical protein
MNERIDELIGKALDQAVPYTWHHLNRVQMDDVMKKFAELMVNECAGIYSKIDNGNLHMGTDNYLEALHKTFME